MALFLAALRNDSKTSYYILYILIQRSKHKQCIQDIRKIIVSLGPLLFLPSYAYVLPSITPCQYFEPVIWLLFVQIVLTLISIVPSLLPASEASYLGCFVDGRDRDLTFQPRHRKRWQMTADVCVEMCKEKGYRYAGLQVFMK